MQNKRIFKNEITFTDDSLVQTYRYTLSIEGLLPILCFNLKLTLAQRKQILGYEEMIGSSIKRKKLKRIKKELENGRLKFFLDSVLKVDDYSRKFNIQLTEIN